MGAQKIPRQFHGEESMQRAGAPRGFHALAVRGVDCDLVRPETLLPGAIVEHRRPREIETKLETVPMKAAAPIDVVIQPKIVPFHAQAAAENAPVQRFPCPDDVTPGGLFLGRRGCAGSLNRGFQQRAKLKTESQ